MMVRPIKTRLKYSGFMAIVDATTDSKITDCVRTTMGVDRRKFYCVHHEGHVVGLMKSTYWWYELSDLNGLHFIESMNKMALRFPFHDHVLYIVGDTLEHLKELKKDIEAARTRFRCTSILDADFTYERYFNSYLNQKKFDKNFILQNNLLSTLILENVTIDRVPVHRADSRIVHLSLNGSVLARCKDKFWDWVSLSGVCQSLQILELNSMKLESLPFEIMYMERLQILSVANNKLTALPHYLAELKRLDELYINNNMIKYLPRGLLDKTFQHFNYRDNNYIENNCEPICVRNHLRNDKKKEIMKLSHLSFLSLIYNRVKLSREIVPSKLHHYFDELGSCIFCHKLIFTQYTYERIEYFYAETYNLVCEDVYRLPWLALECNYPCKRKWTRGERYRFHLKGDDDDDDIIKIKGVVINFESDCSEDEVISDFSDDGKTY